MAAMAETSPSTRKECCLCGDIGFANHLLLCPICTFRLQHTYCSRSYPEIDMAAWRCEWCLYDREKAVAATVAKRPLSIVDHSPEGDEDERRLRQKRDDGRCVSAPGKSRRQRSGGAERWRKLNCNPGPSSRAMGRRYKLLADVLC